MGFFAFDGGDFPKISLMWGGVVPPHPQLGRTLDNGLGMHLRSDCLLIKSKIYTYYNSSVFENLGPYISIFLSK